MIKKRRLWGATILLCSVGPFVAILAAASAGVNTADLSLANTAPLPVPSESATLQSQANAIFERFNGTPFQRDAAGVLQAWALNGPMDGCMSDAGYPKWDWSTTRNMSPRTNALGSSTFLAAPMSNAQSNAAKDMVSSIRAEESLRTMEISLDEQKAVLSCLDQVPQVSDELAESASVPEVIQHLRSDSWSMLNELDQKYGSLTAYAACFHNLAAPEDLIDSAQSDWHEYLAGLLPRASELPGPTTLPDAASLEWKAFVATETKLELLDWRCRGATYVGNLDRALQAVEQFKADHIAEIDQATAAWLLVVDRAKDLGFHGQQGSIEASSQVDQLEVP